MIAAFIIGVVVSSVLAFYLLKFLWFATGFLLGIRKKDVKRKIQPKQK